MSKVIREVFKLHKHSTTYRETHDRLPVSVAKGPTVKLMFKLSLMHNPAVLEFSHSGNKDSGAFPGGAHNLSKS